MLDAIITWSLHNRVLVLGGTVAFAVLAGLSIPYLPIDAFPDPTPVQVQINSQAVGLAPVEVERQVTFPIEQAIGGLPRLQGLRSVSKFGLSQVVVTFEDGTDVYFARQLVNERLGTVELADWLPRPQLGPVATGLGEVFHYLVRGKGRELRDVRAVQDWVIKPALRTVPGTAEINGWGGFEKQYQIRLDPDRLLKYDLAADQVLNAVREANRNVGGGYLPRGGDVVPIHGLSRPTSLEQLRYFPVAVRDNAPVYLADVANVVIGDGFRLGSVTADDRGEAVLGLGFLLMGENSHIVTGRLRDRLHEVKKTLPADIDVEVVYDRTRLIDQVIDTVRKNLFEGGLLVVAVLFVFLGNLRAGLIVALAIPFSMLFAFCGMLRFGIAGSLLSLGALDFGLVVDSSVVLVENVVRHLSHRRDARSKFAVIREAALQVRLPTIYGELIIMIVYLPILTLEGFEGKFFRPMALTVLFALLGSLILSLTVMPVLCALFLPRRMRETEPWVVRLSRWLYAPVLRASLRHKAAVLLLGVGSLGGAILLARGMGSEFVPRLSEGAIVINIARPVGTSLDESMRFNKRMEKLLLRAFPDEVEHVWSRVGTAEVSTDPMGTEETDFFITLRPRDRWRPEIETQDDLVKRIEELYADLPGAELGFTQPIEQRVNEMISGVRADVAVKLFGDDYEVLADKAREVEAVLQTVRGSRDVLVEPVEGQPELQVKVRPDALARYGLTGKAVLDVLESLGGKPLGEIAEGEPRFPLVARLPDSTRHSADALGRVTIRAPGGERVPLGRLADMELIEGPAKVSREWGQRRISVQCNVRDRDLGSFVEEARAAVEREVRLPKGRYRFEWGGQFENLQRASARLALVVPLALALILGLLHVTFRRVRDVILVGTAVPFAAVGGVAALWLRDMPFSISAAVGFIALSGVSVLNSMVLVTFIRQLVDSGRELSRAVEEAALVRLRPVLMTALVASLGFLPMALSTGVGAEVQRPLATVVIGGMITCTLQTLLLLPVLYVLCGGRATTPAGEASSVDTAARGV